MHLIAVMPVRNEEWALEFTLRAALKWNDAVLVLAHECSDASIDIVFEVSRDNPERVWLTSVYGDWDEMAHRQRMLESARSLGATHISIVDADEILTGNLLDSIRLHIESMPPGRILRLPGYNLRGGLDRYHWNGIWGERWFSTAFRDDPRLRWEGDRFHQREPNGMLMQWAQPIMQGQGGIMHLWGASERRLRAKHALYKLTETLRWPAKSKRDIDQLYSLAFTPSLNQNFSQNWLYAEVPAAWWEPYGDLRDRVDLDAIPWQEEECRRLYAQHGPERFAGLDLFGVCATETVNQ